MVESASWTLQQGVYEALSQDVALSALLGGERIFDRVPPDAPYPFVTIGQSIARDWSTSTETGSEHALSLHVWSRAGGKKEVFRIAAAIRQALAATLVSSSEHRLVQLRDEAEDVRLDPDGETYHGLMRIRAVTEQVVAS